MTTDIGKIQPKRIEEELRSSYLDYAMSVIVSRALPDVRDGLKPVQRRILYAMDELAMRPGTAYKKSARLVGEVLGKYHPHGDTSVYDAMVRMAQDFSMRYPLVDGQGNFGSIDNDPPAAMRYTEARLAPIAELMLADLDRNTVDFFPNFDDSLSEPLPLPAVVPNLLVNGASGIAVGMATSIPPHNLREVCDAVCHLIDHPDATVDQLLGFVQGPDFPTGGIMMVGPAGRESMVEAYTTGHGRVVVQGKAVIEDLGKTGRHQIVITEVPYQVNKATMVERIALLSKDKKIDGITEVRDESDRSGLRVVIEMRSSAQPEIVLNNLYKHTSLQMAFSMNMLALVDGQPQVLTLRQMLRHFIDFRVQVVRRRAEFDLAKARDRAHVLEGLLKAIGSLDEVISIIRASDDVEAARTALMTALDLSQIQAQAILEMQLRRLTALDRQRLEDEHQQLVATIAELEALLADPAKVLSVVRTETKDLRKKFGDDRRTVVFDEDPSGKTREELEPNADVVVTLSQNGYTKRVDLSTYRMQHRGGKGVVGMKTTKEDDVVQQVLVADTHDNLLFFTDRGQVFSIKCYDIPRDASRTTRGTPLPVLISALPTTDRVTAVVSFADLRLDGSLVLATRNGEIKRVPLEQFASIRRSGIFAMKNLEADDELIAAVIAPDDGEVIVVTANGMSLCFRVSQLRLRSRAAGGVRAIRLKGDDVVVAMDVTTPNGRLLTVSEHGFGKLTKLEGFRRQGRGGSGVIACKVSAKTGPLAAAVVVEGKEDLVIATAKAQIQKISLSEVGTYGRYARGVWLMRPEDHDRITAVSILAPVVRPAPAISPAPESAPEEEPEADAPAPEVNGAVHTNGHAQLELGLDEAEAPDAEDEQDDESEEDTEE